MQYILSSMKYLSLQARFGKILLVTLVVLLDQWSKGVAVAALLPASPVAVLPCFNFVLVFNKGISFGMLGHNAPQLVALLLPLLLSVIVVVLCCWLLRESEKPVAFALALIVGGALGNLFDRFWRGAVVDFLDFYWGRYHWPAFNLADSFIFIGVAVFLFGNISSKRR